MTILTRLGAILLAACSVMMVASCGGGTSGGASTGDTLTTASGLRYVDVKVGTGPSPQTGQTAVVHYTGWLTNGTKFDSSKDRNAPFTFAIGKGRVIKGWDEGVATMRVGGKRKLIVPPDLGYGKEGAGEKIPPGAYLIFDVNLLEVIEKDNSGE